MAGYRGHLLAGAVFFGAAWHYSPVLSVAQSVAYFACTLLGALFPDIDTKSYGQRIFYIAFLACMLVIIHYKRYQLGTYLGLILLLPLVTTHRGILHSSWFLMAITAILSYSGMYMFPTYSLLIKRAALFFFLGIMSHLLVDFGSYGFSYLMRKLFKLF